MNVNKLFGILFLGAVYTRKILSDNVLPENYKIMIDTHFDEFYGYVSIKANISKPTDTLYLNSYNLSIQDFEIKTGSKTIPRDKIQLIKEYQEIALKMDRDVSGIVYINISYLGNITNNMVGYYVSEYRRGVDKERLYSTHFEPTGARSAFPSFDQPDMKATFDVILTVPENMTGLSNMDVSSECDIHTILKENEDESNPNHQNTMHKLNKMQIDILENSKNKNIMFFNTTPKMSTYLVAFVIGKLEKKETSIDGVQLGVYAPKGEVKHAEYALEMVTKCFEFYQDYFQIKYTLPKLDHVAIPLFEMGAMENWGLVTYRKTKMLYGPDSDTDTKKHVAETVCHEIAHMWLGNLVTMKWWNDLWLNEAFATWASYKALESMDCNYASANFISKQMNHAMLQDGLHNTHPLISFVDDPKNDEATHDGLIYSKGSRMVKMIEDYLGKEFEKRLLAYLRNNMYGNVETKDLWEYLKVGEMMGPWVLQEGFPLVTVEEQDDQLVLRQERFLYVPDYQTNVAGGDNGNDQQFGIEDVDILEDDEAEAEQNGWELPSKRSKKMRSRVKQLKAIMPEEFLWKIPIRITFYGEGMIVDELYMLETKELAIPKKTGTYKLNKNAAGFFITHYKSDLILKELLTDIKLNVSDRLNILNDIIHLTMARIMPIKRVLHLIEFYKGEHESIIIPSILSELSKMKCIFYADINQGKYLTSIISDIIKSRIDEVFLKIDGKDIDDHELPLYTSILNSAVGTGHKGTIEKLGKLYKEYKKNKSVIHPNFRCAMFTSLIGKFNKGELDLFNEIYDMYVIEELDDVKVGMLTSLGAANYFEFLSEKLLEDGIKLQDKIFLFQTLAGNGLTRDRTIAFTMDKFDKIQTIYKDKPIMLGHVIEKVFGVVSHGNMQDKVTKFLKRVKNKDLQRAIHKVLENIEIRIRFRLENLKELDIVD